jgi:hypothetical protein
VKGEVASNCDRINACSPSSKVILKGDIIVKRRQFHEFLRHVAKSVCTETIIILGISVYSSSLW